ncbi:LOW QUALITY PROTEIN: hypothetical protein PHMEG_00016010 [Phytophthora megakarya]|uniref:Eukaryotic/viral aspartic protease n=1 Tax=Phytophthora megakarya TaxID=4795 RepID=A0A225W0B3_9STRA|nr:LOW QUALITY PROTEIN: hypothetical protein PHMEG_00016010 [Phytophthora megakarya]
MSRHWIDCIGSTLRARLKIKDGSAKERREHVDHYIETLEDQGLAERLTLLRLTDAEDLEEVLRARDRAKNRQKKAAFGSSKYRQKPTNNTPSAPAKQVRAIQIQASDSGSGIEPEGSCGSDSDIDGHRRIFLAANEDVPRRWRKSQRTRIHDFRAVIMAIKITTRRYTVMVLTVIGAHTVDPESTRILGAGGVLHARSVAREDIPRITASSCVVDVENGMTWGNVRWKSSITRSAIDLTHEAHGYLIYAFVSKPSVDQVSKRPDLQGNTCDLHGKRTITISSLRQVDEYARSEVTMISNQENHEVIGESKTRIYDHEVTPEIQRPSKISEYRRSATMDLLPGESRGYWKHHSSGKWFRQANITGKIHNETAILLLDTGT